MIVTILQARVSSTRLPSKVLKPLLGQPMLLRQIERIKRASSISNLVVATSTDSSDEAIASLCDGVGVSCFRGSLDDVLDRFYQAALPFNPTHVIRLTGDCPLSDPCVIDEVVKKHLSGSFDYTSNTLNPTFPDGLDVEVASMEALSRAWRDATLTSDREHVMPFIHRQPTLFKLGSYEGETDYSGLRWTVDELVDFELVEIIYSALLPSKPDFVTGDVLQLLDLRPELKVYNVLHKRNSGYLASLEKDKNQSTSSSKN